MMLVSSNHFVPQGRPRSLEICPAESGRILLLMTDQQIICVTWDG